MDRLLYLDIMTCLQIKMLETFDYVSKVTLLQDSITLIVLKVLSEKMKPKNRKPQVQLFVNYCNLESLR